MMVRLIEKITTYKVNNTTALTVVTCILNVVHPTVFYNNGISTEESVKHNFNIICVHMGSHSVLALYML
jgi:hypothetical protein